MPSSCHSPCWNVISQQILMQCWQGEFFCTLHNMWLVCPCLGWYSVPGQCLLNFPTALENAQFLPVICAPQLVVNDCFLPAMCTPQKEWFKRARSFLDVCLTTSRSMSHTRIVTLTWGACVGNKTDKSETINIILSYGNEYVKLAWEFTGKPWRE